MKSVDLENLASRVVLLSRALFAPVRGTLTVLARACGRAGLFSCVEGVC